MSGYKREPEDPVEALISVACEKFGANKLENPLMKVRVLEWDAYFIQMAMHVAARSRDGSTQVGAVIVKDNRVISTGYNGLPSGFPHRAEYYERPRKYMLIEHAERNAIYSAARHGVPLQGATIYVWASTPLSVCADCARGIIQSGITTVYGYSPTRNPTQSHWDASTTEAFEMLAYCNVNFIGRTK